MQRLLLCVYCTFPLVLAACSAGAAPVSNSSHDPSNPAASEAAAASRAPTPAGTAGPAALAGASAGGAHEHHHGSSGADASAGQGATEVVYVCPMHPEVTSKAPGRCPKCGMNLVPKN